ncbi:hypothetical protein Ancab_002715 [Ancistrocladus abbreviatus]
MALASKFSYQRLKHEVIVDEDDPLRLHQEREKETVFSRSSSRRSYSRSWSSTRPRRIHLKRRLKIRIPGLRRFFNRKARLIRASWAKVVNRLKESQSHFGDLFSGNYLFMQINPTSLKNHHAGKPVVGHFNVKGISSLTYDNTL